MSLGRMYYRVTIQKPVDESTRRGTPQTYVTVATVWASMKPLAIKEQVTNNQMQVVADYEFTMWSRSEVDETCKLICATNTYNVVSVFESDPIKKQITIIAKRNKV